MPGRRSHRVTVGLFVATYLLFLSANFALDAWLDKTRSIDHWKYAHSTLLFLLTSPSIFFCLVIFVAGLLASWFGLLKPPALRLPRLTAASIFLIPMFPLGFWFMLMVVFLPASIPALNGPHNTESMSFRVAQFAVVLIFFVLGGCFCVFYAAVASRIATRCWPRRVWRWAIGLSSCTLLATAITHSIEWKIRFPGISAWRTLTNSPLDVFISGVGYIPYVILFGGPTLAGFSATGYTRRVRSSPIGLRVLPHSRIST